MAHGVLFGFLHEIKDKLTQLGLGLGMKLDPGLIELPIVEESK